MYGSDIHPLERFPVFGSQMDSTSSLKSRTTTASPVATMPEIPEQAVKLMHELIEVCKEEESPEAHNVRRRICKELKECLDSHSSAPPFCTMTKFQIDLTRARSRVDARLAKEKTELNEKNITLMLSEKATEVCLTLSAYCNDQDDTVKSEGGLGSGIGGSMTRKRQLEVDLEKEFAELDKLRGEWKKVKTEVDSGDKKEGA